MAEAFAIVQWQDGREEHFAEGFEIHTPHLASVLIDQHAYDSAAGLEAAVLRAFQVCLQLGIPITRHFRRIHVYGADGAIEDDWALSDLGFYLLLLNGDATNPGVARAQAWAIRKTLTTPGVGRRP